MFTHRKTGGLAVTLAALVIAVLMAPAASAAFVPPDMWLEDGDAGGATCASAQSVTNGRGTPVNRIDGSLSGGADVDIYRIGIPDPSNFSATTVGTGTSFDAQLFLFNKANRCQGVIANDDGGPNFQATLSGFAGSQNVYHLAISSFNNDPRDCGGNLIFPSFPFGPVYPPIDNDPLCSFDGSGGGAGPYGIILTGAVFLGS